MIFLYAFKYCKVAFVSHLQIQASMFDGISDVSKTNLKPLTPWNV